MRVVDSRAWGSSPEPWQTGCGGSQRLRGGAHLEVCGAAEQRQAPAQCEHASLRHGSAWERGGGRQQAQQLTGRAAPATCVVQWSVQWTRQWAGLVHTAAAERRQPGGGAANPNNNNNNNNNASPQHATGDVRGGPCRSSHRRLVV